MKKIKLIFIILLSALLVANPVFAEYDEDFFSRNDILFYNPDDTGTDCSSLINSDEIYSATIIEKQKAIATFLGATNFKYNNNKPLNAVQMAAVLGNLYTESRTLDPSSGVADDASHKGIGQWASPGRWDSIADPKTDMVNQLNFLVSELDGDYYGKNVGNFWNITEYADLEEATYLIARNYEVAITEVSSSQSWSVDYDASDKIQGWNDRFKFAQDMYEKYGELAGGKSSCMGMSLEQAKDYAYKYETSNGLDLYTQTKCSAYDSNQSIKDFASKRILANCVAVITYFIQNNTTFEHIGLPNGGQVVETLINHGWTDGGNVPKAYSVFSTSENSSDPSVGHTGLVLGVDGDIVYVFQEGCSMKLVIDGGKLGVKAYSMKDMQASDYKFAYPPDGVLKNI